MEYKEITEFWMKPIKRERFIRIGKYSTLMYEKAREPPQGSLF